MSVNIEQARFARRIQDALQSLSDAAGDLAAAMENATGMQDVDAAGSLAVTLPVARGPRQQEIVRLLWEEETERGLKTSQIAGAVEMDQPNAYLALQALQKQGLVELVPNVQPQHWRLAPAYRLSRKIVDVASLVHSGEWTSYGDISQIVYGHARGGLAVARVITTSPDVDNPHRIIKSTGEIPSDWRDGDLGPQECARRLSAEGVEVDNYLFAHGRQHVDHEELARRLSKMPTSAPPP